MEIDRVQREANRQTDRRKTEAGSRQITKQKRKMETRMQIGIREVEKHAWK